MNEQAMMQALGHAVEMFVQMVIVPSLLVGILFVLTQIRDRLPGPTEEGK